MSITFIAKLGGKYTVPEGAIILMPTESNPVGFARFSSMDSYCLAAADSTDATVVGLNPHTHPVSISSMHSTCICAKSMFFNIFSHFLSIAITYNRKSSVCLSSERYNAIPLLI